MLECDYCGVIRKVNLDYRLLVKKKLYIGCPYILSSLYIMCHVRKRKK